MQPPVEHDAGLPLELVLVLVGASIWFVLYLFHVKLASEHYFVAGLAGVAVLLTILARRIAKSRWPVRRRWFSRSQLVKELGRKYGSTHFYIEDDERSFYRRIADVLVSSISRYQLADTEGSPASQTLSVGIVGGPMVLETAREISSTKLASKLEFDTLRFVAMNKAAESHSFQFSATFLATFLSVLFRNSKAVPYAPDEECLTARKGIRILLCSAGNWREGYLQSWLEKRRARQGQQSQTARSPIGLELFGACVGDFCLQPIDRDGRRIGSNELLTMLETDVDPLPTFQRLSDLANQKCEVILPIGISAKRGLWRVSGRTPRQLTGKEAIAKAVLASGAIRACILPEPLAQNLVFSIGNYLFNSVSPTEPDRPMRLCRVQDLADSHKRSTFYVYDPLGRLDAVSFVDGQMRPKEESLDIIPDVIVSEAFSELKQFDFKRNEGVITFRFAGQSYELSVTRGTRKPGQFSKLILQLVCDEIRMICQRGRGNLAIWDVGCGTGFIGLLVARTLNETVAQVDLSDISDDAVRCTENNRSRLQVDAKLAQVFRSDLVKSPRRDSYDIVVFNAPFLPDGLPESHGLDLGGSLGPELAVEFAHSVRERLRDGGAAIVTTTDYVDDGRIRAELVESFGVSNVSVRDRLILYPIETPNGVERAYEVKYRETIEAKCGYRFETCLIGRGVFLAFQARHYIARRQ